MSEHKHRIAHRFAAAAASYDGAARIQGEVARALAADIAQRCETAPTAILEFGCGTGNLTGALAAHFPMACVIASDLAPAMVAACRRNQIGRATQVVAMDAEAPAFAEGSFDLVCGSLAAQWFTQPERSFAGLARLLRPGGILAFTTLGSETFQEWRAAAALLGLADAGPRYPSLARLEQQCSSTLAPLHCAETHLWDEHPSAFDFLQSLRRIGADVPAAGARPLSPGALRRILRGIDAKGRVRATYHVLSVVWRRRTP